MRAPIATLSLTGLLLVSTTMAQEGPSGNSQPQATPDSKPFPAEGPLPTPTPPGEIPPSTLALPNDPIGPWLLTKDNGPFMVMAKTFRGPAAERYALALAMELRKEYGLPAYILRLKDFPMHSLIRNVPPTAPSFVKQPHLTEPEKVRSYDEAMVLVGDEKTLEGSLALLHRVQKIHPNCLNEIASPFGWRKGQGLGMATRTTNPYVPTQTLYPGRGPRPGFLAGMNHGPHSVNNCPGRYSLQVAEFGGLSTFSTGKNDARLFDNNLFKKSALASAADNAELLAQKLSRDPDVRRTGTQPYVYHGLSSSKVYLGSFANPNDPAAPKLRETVLRTAVPMAERMKMGIIIAPAPMLTDLDDPNKPMKFH